VSLIIDHVKQEVRAFLTALAFFTRLPIPIRRFCLPESAFYLPLLGYFLGAFLAFAGWFWSSVLNPWLLALFILALQYYLANFFHFDGLLDMVDALAAFGGVEKRLAVLKTPEVGALGLLFGFFFLLGEFLMMKEVVAQGLWGVILLRPAAGRLLLSLVALWGRPAKKEGLGVIFLKHTKRRFILAQIFWIPILVLTPWAGLITMCLVIPLVLKFQRNFGGLTGDLLGASVEIGEWVFLAVVVLGLKGASW